MAHALKLLLQRRTIVVKFDKFPIGQTLFPFVLFQEVFPFFGNKSFGQM